MTRHPGIRHGRVGRPSRADEIDAGIRCECGELVERHAPLPPVRPLTSWHAERGARLDDGRPWTLRRT